MSKFLYAVAVTAMLAGVPLLTGCDKAETTKETTHTNPDGTTTVDKSKSTTDSNGNTSTSTEHKTN